MHSLLINVKGNFIDSIFYRCTEEGSQLKLVEVAQSPLVKQLLDSNVSKLHFIL